MTFNPAYSSAEAESLNRQAKVQLTSVRGVHGRGKNLRFPCEPLSLRPCFDADDRRSYQYLLHRRRDWLLPRSHRLNSSSSSSCKHHICPVPISSRTSSTKPSSCEKSIDVLVARKECHYILVIKWAGRLFATPPASSTSCAEKISSLISIVISRRRVALQGLPMYHKHE